MKKSRTLNRRILILGLIVAGLSASTLAISGMKQHCPVTHNDADALKQQAATQAPEPYAPYIQQHRRHAQTELHALTRYNLDRFR